MALDPAAASAPGRAFRAPVHLLHDGSLTLRVHPSLAPAAAPWIPGFPSADPTAATAQGPFARPSPGATHCPAPAHPPAPPARMRLAPSAGRPFPVPQGEPTLQMLRVRAWMEGARVRMASQDGAVRGSADLHRMRATVGVRGTAPFSQHEMDDVACALTIAAALLLGRGGRALLHAGAVVAPDGRAWLLVGDSRSGKTTACANLIRAGSGWLADDQVVVWRGEGGVCVEGWPRAFSLDVGFRAGTPAGLRAPADAATLGPGRWRRSAPLGGVLLPRVEAAEPTRLEPAHPAAALGALVRQSPWLLADGDAAPRVLDLLSAVAGSPRFGLRAGLDSYGDPRLLHECVAELVSS